VAVALGKVRDGKGREGKEGIGQCDAHLTMKSIRVLPTAILYRSIWEVALRSLANAASSIELKSGSLPIHNVSSENSR